VPSPQEKDEQKRDGWWAELRSELVLHAESLDCTHVIGYREQVHIWDDVCVLSVVGTAATLKDAAGWSVWAVRCVCCLADCFAAGSCVRNPKLACVCVIAWLCLGSFAQ
jgi:hypothetical protein